MPKYRVWFINNRNATEVEIEATSRHTAIEKFAIGHGVRPSSYIQARLSKSKDKTIRNPSRRVRKARRVSTGKRRVSGLTIAKQSIRKRKIRTRKNPVGKFVIVGYTATGPNNDWFYQASRDVFANDAAGLRKATRYKSRSHAERVAKSLLPKLPARIKSLAVETA